MLMENVALILITFAVAGALRIHWKSTALMEYLKDNHHSVWVSMGSPKTVAIAGGTESPAYSFVYRYGYQNCSDERVHEMCASIQRMTSAVILGFVFLLLVLIVHVVFRI